MTNWTLQTSTTFKKQFKNLDRTLQIRILAYFKNRVLPSNDPKSFAKPLTGDLSGYWRFRIGDYRVIADIEDDICTIIAVEVAHRREIYDS